MKKWIVISLLALAGCWGVQAQTQTVNSTAVAQADTTVLVGGGRVPSRGVDIPEKVREFLAAERYKDALAEYIKYRPTIEENDFLATYSDMDFYGGMSATFPEKTEYREKYEAAKKKIHSAYSNRLEVILLELDELPIVTNEDIIRVYTKVLEVDSTYIGIYFERGMALMNTGRMKEACHDFRKHPDYDKMIWKAECESYFEQEAIEEAAQEEATKAEEK